MKSPQRLLSGSFFAGTPLPDAGRRSHAMAGDRERCLTVGMDDYLSKPLDKDEALVRLERISAAASDFE